MRKILSLLLLCGAFSASYSEAKDLEIFFCQARSERFPKLSIQLLVNAKGKLVGQYALGKDPWFNPERVNFTEKMTIPSEFKQMMIKVNQFENTGIDPSRVTHFQNILVDGTNRYDVELWKLFDQSGQTVGWVTYAFHSLMGCY